MHAIYFSKRFGWRAGQMITTGPTKYDPSRVEASSLPLNLLATRAYVTVPADCNFRIERSARQAIFGLGALFPLVACFGSASGQRNGPSLGVRLGPEVMPGQGEEPSTRPMWAHPLKITIQIVFGEQLGFLLCQLSRQTWQARQLRAERVGVGERVLFNNLIAARI